MEDNKSLTDFIAWFNELSPVEQVTIWRVLGEGLLRSGNSFQAMIQGMPLLERAIYNEYIAEQVKVGKGV